jgi:hypothetical protein
MMNRQSDYLDCIFTTGVREAWRNRPSEDVIWRLHVLEACGPYPSDQMDAMRVARFRALKASWEAYLAAGDSCGLFDGNRGNDMRARLTDRNPGNFRSALAECLACWFLRCHLGLHVEPDTAGRGAKNCDMHLRLDDLSVGVEVKAPFRARSPNGEGWCGGEDDKLSEAINAANKQMDDRCPNLLVLVPDLRTSICEARTDLLRAAFGVTYGTLDVDPITHQTGPFRLEFDAAGRFLRPQKPGGLPGCQRISAILCIEPQTITTNCRSILDLWFFDCQRSQAVVDHRGVVIHNPCAYHSLPRDIWGDCPQLLPDGQGSVVWTDGKPAYV